MTGVQTCALPISFIFNMSSAGFSSGNHRFTFNFSGGGESNADLVPYTISGEIVTENVDWLVLI